MFKEEILLSMLFDLIVFGSVIGLKRIVLQVIFYFEGLFF
jgi:hypothetical protein